VTSLQGAIMPAKKPAPPGTLGYLGECGATIYVVCDRCSRFTIAKLEEIAKHAGWHASAAEVGKRLKCKECGHRGGRLTTQRPYVGRAVCPRCLRPLATREK